MGFARLGEDLIRSYKGKAEGESLNPVDKIASSALGWYPIGGLSLELPRTNVQ